MERLVKRLHYIRPEYVGLHRDGQVVARIKAVQGDINGVAGTVIGGGGIYEIGRASCRERV